MAIFHLIRSLSTSFLPPSASSFRHPKSRIFSVRNHTAASGYRALDRELPNGGWPSAVLNELLLSGPDIGELCLLEHALPQMLAEGKTLLLLASPAQKMAARLHELKIALHQVILIETDHPAEQMATVEQIMRDPGFGALLCWLPEVRDDHLQRLHAAVSKSKGWAFVFRPLQDRDRPSPAMLRVICQSVARTCISVEIIKRRGRVQGKPLILPLRLPLMHVPMSARVASIPSGTPASAAYATQLVGDQYQVDRSALTSAATQHRAFLRHHSRTSAMV